MEYLDAVWGKPSITGEFYLNEGDILDSLWKGGKFTDVRIAGGSMNCSLFENCTFTNTTFENIYLEHVDFVRCHFENFKIINCTREGMEMRECTGSPPTLIGTKAPGYSLHVMQYPPGWGPETGENKQ